jgi:hypothetical protein
VVVVDALTAPAARAPIRKMKMRIRFSLSYAVINECQVLEWRDFSTFQMFGRYQNLSLLSGAGFRFIT